MTETRTMGTIGPGPDFLMRELISSEFAMSLSTSSLIRLATSEIKEVLHTYIFDFSAVRKKTHKLRIFVGMYIIGKLNQI